MIKFSNFLKYSKNTKLAILIFFVFFTILLVIAGISFFDNSLRVSFYDIGQGNAVFIETPKNYQILIDGGPGPLILRKLGSDMPFWDRTIDLIIATHQDADHISGLIDVLSRYKVKNVLINSSIYKDTIVFKSFYNAILNEGAKIYLAKEGQKFSDIEFKTIYPFSEIESLKDYNDRKDYNDISIVNLLEYNGIKIMFTGDATEYVEYKLLEKYQNLDIDILQVGHHGSKTSSSFNFLKTITPNISIIQVGMNNRYKHPNKNVIERFQNLGIPIWRTDLDGDLRLSF